MDIPIENQRLKQIRLALDLTQTAFAEILGERQSTADMERGKTRLSGKVVMTLLKEFQINPLWLYGESEKRHLNTTDVVPKAITVTEDGTENILLVNAKAAAGYGQNIGDHEYMQQLPAFHFPLSEFKNASFRGFQITGDSMIPLIKSGDWALAKAVYSFDDVVDNQIYVIVETESIRLKKVRRKNGRKELELISLNPEYPATVVSAESVLELWEYHSKVSFGIEKIQGLTLHSLHQEIQHLKEAVRNNPKEVN